MGICREPRSESATLRKPAAAFAGYGLDFGALVALKESATADDETSAVIVANLLSRFPSCAHLLHECLSEDRRRRRPCSVRGQ